VPRPAARFALVVLLVGLGGAPAPALAGNAALSRRLTGWVKAKAQRASNTIKPALSRLNLLGIKGGGSLAFKIENRPSLGRSKPAVAPRKVVSRLSSTANLMRLRGELGALHADEHQLMERIEELTFGFTHRVTAEKLGYILDQGHIATLENSRGTFKSSTPASEIALYDADKYVFGYVGFWSPSNKYGDVVVHVKDRTWEQKSWASQKSGYEYFMAAEKKSLGRPLQEAELTYNRYDTPSPELVAGARRELEKDAIMPQDYKERSALGVVKLLRDRGIAPKKFLSMGKDQLRRELGGVLREEYMTHKNKVGFFEGKIGENLAGDDIDRVEIKNTAANRPLIERLHRAGIKVELQPEES
jgi:hypothetical protein